MLSKQILQSIPKAIRVLRSLSKRKAKTSIPLQQLRILFLIRDGLGQTDMADALSVSMPAISKMINTLVEKDYVERHPGADRRCLSLSLTAKGSKIMNQVSRSLETSLERGLSKLTKTEKVELQQGLEILDRLMVDVNEV